VTAPRAADTPDPTGAADPDQAEVIDGELLLLRNRVAAAEAQLAQQRRTRLGMVARLVRAAVKDPSRRRTLRRDVARAVLDRSFASYSTVGGTVRYPLPAFDLPTGPVARPDLRVAVILDPFSELAFRFEWTSVPVTPQGWRSQLEGEPPDLLFVESAWRGGSGAWSFHMTRAGGPSPELAELVAWCRARAIPTVFWNKEDPPNYERFLPTARLFDRVFTVDADRIPAYQRDLGHDRVGLLPFAAQPRIHNPVQRGAGRVYDVAFAGSYFADKHHERRAQMEYVLAPALDFGLHVYSRHQNDDDRYRFPPAYRSHIVGSLPYEQMLAAYTSYKVFLNVNSVTTSRTMCARRLFELSAAQTAVVTAPADSVEPFFGTDITVVTSAEETRDALTALGQHDEYRDRMTLRAHRRVFDDHLFAHRVDTVLRSVGLPTVERQRSVSAVVPTNRPGQVDHVLGFVGRQSHHPLQLVLVQHGFSVDAAELRARAKDQGVDDVVVLTADESVTLGACMNLGVDAAEGDLVAKMDDDNFYGRHYLRDLVRAFDYTDAEVVGKWAHLVHLEGSGATLLRFPYAEHRFTTLVQGGTLVVRRTTARETRFEDLPRRVDTTFLDKVRAGGGTVYSTDRFNFVSVRRTDPASHTWTISEKEILARKARLLFYGEPYQHAEV
jgi:spore maturation protein CgeB